MMTSAWGAADDNNAFSARRFFFFWQTSKHERVGGKHHSVGAQQCDQKKIAKCLQKLPKNDFTRKMIDFDTFKKIA